MHFYAKTVDGKSFPVSIKDDDSIKFIKSSIEEASHIPSSIQRLVYKGAVLDDDACIQDYDITEGAIVNLILRLRGGGPSKKRCSFKACTSAPLRIVGDCSFCDGHFCSKHRLLEDHKCTGLQNCKQQLHERNALKLQQEQTVASKV
ncbi:ubiquitin-related domain-containing protein [Dipodascopsis uninucleata]